MDKEFDHRPSISTGSQSVDGRKGRIEAIATDGHKSSVYMCMSALL